MDEKDTKNPGLATQIVSTLIKRSQLQKLKKTGKSYLIALFCKTNLGVEQAFVWTF